MASTNQRTGFDTLDLAILDSVNQAAWAQLVVRSPVMGGEFCRGDPEVPVGLPAPASVGSRKAWLSGFRYSL